VKLFSDRNYRKFVALAISLVAHVLIITLLSIDGKVNKKVTPYISKIRINRVFKEPTARPAISKRTGSDSSRPKSKRVKKESTAYQGLLPQWSSTKDLMSKPSGMNETEPSYGDLDSILMFARDAYDFIYLPSQLKKLYSSGSTQAKIRLVDSKYQIVRIMGDPYFRALLFERLTELLKSNASLEKLKFDQVKQINLELVFIKQKQMNSQATKKKLLVNEHRITILFEIYEQIEAMRLLTAQSAGDDESPSIGINVLAPILYLVERLTDEGVNDRSLRDLRSSPAYAKPIYKR